MKVFISSHHQLTAEDSMNDKYNSHAIDYSNVSLILTYNPQKLIYFFMNHTEYNLKTCIVRLKIQHIISVSQHKRRRRLVIFFSVINHSVSNLKTCIVLLERYHSTSNGKFLHICNVLMEVLFSKKGY